MVCCRINFRGRHKGFASESSTRRRCLSGSACTMQPLAIWLTCVCRPTLCMVASNNYVPRRLGLCWSRVPGLLPVSAASPSMDHKRRTVCQPILEHQIRLSAPSSIISRPTCFSSSLRCCWQVGSAPFVRRRCDCLASSAPFINYSDLLTYLLIIKNTVPYINAKFTLTLTFYIG